MPARTMEARKIGTNRLGLGVFAFNGVTARTTIPEAYRFGWKSSLDVARRADMAGFEAIVPYARYRAYAHAQHRSGHVFDSFTWASALAAKTETSFVMSTCHVLNMHPVLVAKACATIDHVSDGRFALNIVCGWFRREVEMLGFEFPDRAKRYAYADEWITIIKRLWSEEDEFDFDGKYFQLKEVMSQPKPVQKPFPMLMNAGGSPEGRNFVAKHCDIAFVPSDTYEGMRAEAIAYRQIARERYGREIQVWAACAMVQGDTNADAEKFADYCRAHADNAYMDEYFTSQGRNLTPEADLALRRKYAAGGSGLFLIGEKHKLADDMKMIADSGIDGILLTWVDYQDGIRRFNAEVLPLLEQAGLRAPAGTALA